MSIHLTYLNYTIEVVDEQGEEVDLIPTYQQIIQVEKDKPYKPNAQHGIRVFQQAQAISSALIMASGGATGISDDAAFIDQENLIIRCCNKVYSLQLPSLNINWITEADWATCFSIHPYENSYIVYGEMAISRLERDGSISWSFSGADIFVCLDKGTPFEMQTDGIALTDFTGSTYMINYQGEQINYTPSNPADRQMLIFSKKPWWKFW